MYTKHTLFLCVYIYIYSNFFLYQKQNKNKNKLKINKQKHVKQSIKTRCRYLGGEEEGEGSSHGDNTNVLMKEFETFTVKRFGK